MASATIPQVAPHNQSSSNPRLSLLSRNPVSIPAFLLSRSLLFLHTPTSAFFQFCDNSTRSPPLLFLEELYRISKFELISQAVAMASDGPALERCGEMRERPSLEGQQQQQGQGQPHHGDTGLHRTAEIHETESGNVELRKDPDHTSKPLVGVSPEQILDPRGASVATKPEDILAVRRDETDTHLE